jgi:ABC-type nitrate/sulfonate/bicarbonate transport system substrate-binding protein
LTTTVAFKEREPDVVASVVRAFARGADHVRAEPADAAEIASRYIGINERFIVEALHRNVPNVDAIRNTEPMGQILELMRELGYVDRVPTGFADLSFLDSAQKLTPA